MQNRRTTITSLILICLVSCAENDPISQNLRIGIIGEPFEANKGDIVQFDEVNMQLTFQHFDDYTHGSIAPNTTVRVEIRDVNSYLTLELYVFESDVLRGFSERPDSDSNDNFFIHYAPVGDLTLEMTKLVWNDNSASPRKVKLAEFLLR